MVSLYYVFLVYIHWSLDVQGRFLQSLRYRKQAIDKYNEIDLPVGEYVSTDMCVRVGPSMLNEKIHTKYCNVLAKLDESKINVHILGWI